MAKFKKENKSGSGKKIQGSNKNILGKKKPAKKISLDKEIVPKNFKKKSTYKSYQAAGADKKKEDNSSPRREKKFGAKPFDKTKKKFPFSSESKFTGRKKNIGEDTNERRPSYPGRNKSEEQKDSFQEGSRKKFVRDDKPRRFKGTSASGTADPKRSTSATQKKRNKPEEQKNDAFSGGDKKRFVRNEKPRSFRETKASDTADAKDFADTTPKKTVSKKTESSADGKIRLNRYISNAGICSRRDADKMIQEGLIRVNGEVVTELGYKVNPEDSIKYGNKVLKREKSVYILLNKPKDFITTVEDPDDRKTVMDLVKNACEERVYPVGRLDRNTTGLLLLTNDGTLASRLAHPSNEVKKIYLVDLDKPLEEEDFQKIISGLELEDGLVAVDDIEIVSADRKSIGLEIHVGRNRIVRRIFEHLGYEVIQLDRVMYAGLTKKDLPRGKWRILSPKEVMQLKRF